MRIWISIIVGLLTSACLHADDRGEFESLRFQPASQSRLAEVEIEAGLPETFDQSVKELEPDSSISYLQFQYGDESSRSVCLKYDGSSPSRLYVDADRNQKFNEEELIESDDSGVWFVDLTAEYGQRPNQTEKQRVRIRHDEKSSKWYLATAGIRNGKAMFAGELRDAKLEDRNANGLWFDREDRLFVDFDGNGKISRLTERIPAQGMRKIRGKMYAISGSASGESVELSEVEGSGFLNAKIEMAEEGAMIRSISGVLGSRAGVGISFESVDQPIEVPVGDWHLETLRIEVTGDDGVYLFAFARLGSKTLVSVADGETHELDLIGELKLEASVVVQKQARNSSLVLTPNLTTGSGCYLIASRTGERSPVNENRLMAFSRSPQATLPYGSSGFS